MISIFFHLLHLLATKHENARKSEFYTLLLDGSTLFIKPVLHITLIFIGMQAIENHHVKINIMTRVYKKKKKKKKKNPPRLLSVFGD